MNLDIGRWTQLEQQKRKLSLEALRLYRPSQLQVPLHLSGCPEVIMRGGKRSGKSISMAMEFASRVLGIPLLDPNGNEIPLRYKVSTPDAPLQFWIIGWDTSHAATIHRLLFQRGMGGTLRAIPDEGTGQWRIWNRADPRDAERFPESLLTEPIIPQRFWKGGAEDSAFSWEEKKAYKWQSCELENGTIIYYWPSSSKSPKQGEAVAGIWIDEDIQFPGHLREWQDRLTDHAGWFGWSVWPHTKNNALIDLLDRASQAKQDEKPQICAFQLIMSENPFLTDEGKEQSLERMGSEEEIARRDRGELLLDMLSMYDYVPQRHLIKKIETGEKLPNDPPRNLLRKIATMSGRLPREWTRYLVIDPSNTRTAVGSYAIPPPEWEGVAIGHVAIEEWEYIARKFSAPQLAEALHPLMSGLNYEAFIMDQQIGKQTNVGRDDTVFDVYEKAFRKMGLTSRLTINGFLPACNVRPVRWRAVRTMLEVTEAGIPMLMLVENKTWATQREFGTYRKKTETKEGELNILDQPANEIKHDAMAVTEYACAYLLAAFQTGTAWVDPNSYGGRGSAVVKKARSILKKQQENEGEYVHLGPGDSADL